MIDVRVKGIEAVQRRLAGRGLSDTVGNALRREAEAIAAAAADAAPGELGRSVEVREVSRGDTIAFAIGTAHPAGRYLEYGTVKRPATPWLWPAFRARLPHIKQTLRKVLPVPFKGLAGGV